MRLSMVIFIVVFLWFCNFLSCLDKSLWCVFDFIKILIGVNLYEVRLSFEFCAIYIIRKFAGIFGMCFWVSKWRSVDFLYLFCLYKLYWWLCIKFSVVFLSKLLLSRGCGILNLEIDISRELSWLDVFLEYMVLMVSCFMFWIFFLSCCLCVLVLVLVVFLFCCWRFCSIVFAFVFVSVVMRFFFFSCCFCCFCF